MLGLIAFFLALVTVGYHRLIAPTASTAQEPASSPMAQVTELASDSDIQQAV